MKTPQTRMACAAATAFAFTLSACAAIPHALPAKYTLEELSDGTTSFVRATNPGDAPAITYSPEGTTGLVEAEQEGSTYAFKDLNGDGELQDYEDWRNTCSVRASSLAAKLTKEQLSGLMLFSAHQRSAEDGLTDEQKEFLSKDRIRNVLASTSNNVEANVTWTNAMQAYAETLGTANEPYLPINFSSDPRSSSGSSSYTANDGVYFPEAGTGKTLSLWPSNLGLAATFDPERIGEMAEMVSSEYRALGIQMALGPQIDLVTDPRNLRNNGMFGEDKDMASAMAAAFVRGFQNTFGAEGEAAGYGEDSVVTTIKHFPGDGAGEGGREGHNPWGKYVVYPGGREGDALEVFEAAKDSGAVMMSYSVGVAADGTAAFGDLVGSAYDKGKVDILREDNDYEGVIMTDWGVTTGSAAFGQKDFGVEDLSVEGQHYAIVKAGVDMYGGNNALDPVLAAYDLWQADYEASVNGIDARTRWEQSGSRILTMMCNTGTFDNPYTDLEHSREVAGDQLKIDAGIDAQLSSVVMLKNVDGAVQCSAKKEDYSDKTVYIPNTYSNAFNFAIMDEYFTEGPTLDTGLAGKYFGTVVTDTPILNEAGDDVERYETPDLSEVDMVLVSLGTPNNGGMPGHGFNPATNEYRPVSLQYRPYTADGDEVRKVSIAGDILADGSKENRSYFGKTSSIENEADLDAFERAVAAVKASGRDIPIITIIQTAETGAVIPAEFEAESDAIFIGYEVAQEAYFQLALGLVEPSGRLPLGLPKDMDSVEASFEDVPKDVASYVDSQGNTYAYGFGMNCSGVIE